MSEKEYKGIYKHNPHQPAQINLAPVKGAEDVDWRKALEAMNKTGIVFTESPRIAKCVPYQVCPICNGSGALSSSSTTIPFITCPTCSGVRIIPMHVLNDKQDETNRLAQEK